MKKLTLLALWLCFVSHAEETQTEVYREIPIGIGIDLHYVPVSFPQYVWTEDKTNDKRGHGFRLGVEWMPFDERYGKLGVGLNTGILVVKNANFGEQNATLTAIPVEVAVTYRLDYFVDQILVPFGKVAGGPTFVRQRGIDRADWMTFRGFTYGGGLELNIGRIDRDSSAYLRHSTGIQATYLVAEYLRTQYLGESRGPNLTRDELHVGLRFEM